MPKRKATAVQLRNLAKGRKKLAAMRRAGTVTRKKSTRAVRPRRKRNPEDISHEAYELVLWIENSPRLQNQRESIIKNVIRKINNGTYDPAKAPRLWQYLMDSAAKDYTKEFGEGRGYGVFTAPMRREAAAWYAPLEYPSIARGEYSNLLALKPTGKRAKKKRASKRNPAYGNFMTARNVLRTGRTTNPAHKATGARQTYLIRQQLAGNKLGKYYDGKGWTESKTEAAGWTNLKRVKVIAKAVADRSGKTVAIFTTVR